MFNFFKSKKPIPAPPSERVELIKMLVAARIERSPALKMNLLSYGGSIDDLSDEQLMTAPEAGVLAFYEQYTAITERGASGVEAITILHEGYAAMFKLNGVILPFIDPPHTFERYASHMLDHGNVTGMPIDSDLVSITHSAAKKFYGR